MLGGAELAEQTGTVLCVPVPSPPTGTVPVYFGAPDVGEFMPPGSFLEGSKQQRDELRRRMVKAHEDIPAYLSFHAWRR